MDFSLKKIFFAILFSALVLLGSQINFSALVGAPNQFFTLFQFFGPIAGAFLGPIAGAFSVLVAETINFFLVGKEITLLNIARLFPMVFAAYYFGTTKRRDWSAIILLIAIFAFVLHPVGQTVWFFAVMFWCIPLVLKWVFPAKLFAKSLGATFTAHAVGGAIWVYLVPMPAEAWVALIPVVIFERVLFALGISASYVLMTTFFARIENLFPEGVISVNKNYDLKRLFALK